MSLIYRAALKGLGKDLAGLDQLNICDFNKLASRQL